MLVLSNNGKGMQSSSEKPLVEEEHFVTTLITAAKETIRIAALFVCKVVPLTMRLPTCIGLLEDG